jgi:membrane-associated protease RseP (regulator of RpoE activity)
MGSALLALTALCPISHANEAETAGQGHVIGVSVEPVRGDAYANGRSGLVVTKVTWGGPADLAGIDVGDVLLVVGAVTLRHPEDLARAERRIQAGQPVSVAVGRNDGREIKVVNLLVPAPAGPSGSVEETDVPTPPVPEVAADAGPGVAQVSPSEGPAGPRLARLGLKCEDLNADLAVALRTPPGRGALVLRVQDDSPMALAGIRAGDVIRRVGVQEIWGVQHLDRTLEGASGPISMVIRRQGVERKVELTLAGPPASEPGPSDSSPSALVMPASPSGDPELLALRRELAMLRREVQRLSEEVAGFKRSLAWK